MKVYHGSTVRVEHPRIDVGRDGLDFGRGFYVTKLREQAAAWTGQLLRRRPGGVPMISEYELDDDYARHCRHLIFEGYCEAWLDFIVANRTGQDPWRSYDAIEGGVANDKVFDTIEIYLSGQITKETALGRLAYAKQNHQICITSQDVLDRHLHFVGCTTI